MAKRRRSSKKSSKCPEPFNTLIDIAAGLTMGAVASCILRQRTAAGAVTNGRRAV